MDGFGYTALHPSSTRLPVTIWIGTPMGFDGGLPRILASSVPGTSRQLSGYFSVDLETAQFIEEVTGLIPPLDVSRIELFVRLNQFALLAHWLGRIDTAEAIGLLAIPYTLDDNQEQRK